MGITTISEINFLWVDPITEITTECICFCDLDFWVIPNLFPLLLSFVSHFVMAGFDEKYMSVPYISTQPLLKTLNNTNKVLPYKNIHSLFYEQLFLTDTELMSPKETKGMSACSCMTPLKPSSLGQLKWGEGSQWGGSFSVFYGLLFVRVLICIQTSYTIPAISTSKQTC